RGDGTRGRPAREAGPPRSPGARPRPPRGGEGWLPVGRALLDASRLRAARVREGWPWRRPWRGGAAEPRPLAGARPAAGVARAPTPPTPASRGAPPPPGRMGDA